MKTISGFPVTRTRVLWPASVWISILKRFVRLAVFQHGRPDRVIPLSALRHSNQPLHNQIRVERPVKISLWTGNLVPKVLYQGRCWDEAIKDHTGCAIYRSDAIEK